MMPPAVVGVVSDKPVDILFLKFDDTTRSVRVRWWIDSFAHEDPILDKVNAALETALADAGIDLSFDKYNWNVFLNDLTQNNTSSTTTEKGKNVNKFFNAVFSLRYVALLAVVAPFFGAVLMLLFGTLNTVEAYLIFFGLDEPDGAVGAGEEAMIKLVASIDHFLFATILIIFAIGLYTLFFRSSSKSGKEKTHAKSPSWNRIKNLGGMDEMLLKVIIMLLSVAFLEFMLNTGIDTLDWPVLVVPLTIIALAIGLKWMSADSEDDTKKVEAEFQTAMLEELEQLATLWKEGAITDTEYEHAKKKRLSA